MSVIVEGPKPKAEPVKRPPSPKPIVETDEYAINIVSKKTNFEFKGKAREEAKQDMRIKNRSEIDFHEQTCLVQMNNLN